MSENKKSFLSTFIQFFKFGVVGLSNTLISYTVYSALVFVGVYYLIASVISFVVSVLNSFFWNNKYVFKEQKGERHILKSLVRTFAAYGLTGLILNNIMLFILVDKINLSKYLAPLLCLIITIPLNFILNKFWAFNTSRKIVNLHSDIDESSTE